MATTVSAKVKDLSGMAQEIVKDKQICGKGRLADWLEMLRELAEFDKLTDAKHKKAKTITILSIVLMVVMIIVTAIVADKSSSSAAMVATLGIAGACLLSAIVFGIKASMLGRVDLQNDFRECLVPVLEILDEDIPAKGKVEMALTLDRPDTKAKQVSKQKIPPGRNRKVVETIYADPWCHLKAPLAAGNRLQLDIDKTVISYDRYYTSRSGKFKHKRKWKALTTVTASIIPDTGSLAWDQGQVEGIAQEEKVKLAEKKGEPVCSLVRKFKAKAMEVPKESVEPDQIVGMFVQLCGMLAPAAERSG